MSRAARLSIVLALNVVLIAGLAAVGIAAHSIGVLSEALDYVADAVGVAISLWAIRISAQRTASGDQPSTATSVAALVNGGWLLLLCVLVSAEAIRRLVTGVPEVHGLPVLLMSATAAAAMVVGAFVLGRDVDDGDDDDGAALNMRAVMLDTVADAAAAAGVAVTGGVILVTGGLYLLDPMVALLVAAVIGYHATHLLADIAIQLRKTP